MHIHLCAGSLDASRYHSWSVSADTKFIVRQKQCKRLPLKAYTAMAADRAQIKTL